MKRKLIITAVTAIILVFVVTISLVGYINNRFADVGNISITAKTDSTALMSADGINWSEDLTKAQIEKAIVAKYRNFTFNDDGNFVDKDGNEVDSSKDAISEYIKKIKFAAVTTLNGRDFYKEDNIGNKVNLSTQHGRYVSFDLYFKSQRDYEFNLYFNTKEFQTNDLSETVKIESKAIDLNSGNFDGKFNMFDSLTGEVIEWNNQSDILVKPSDAMRFSTTVNNGEGDITKIYEPNIGLGSYATKLDSETYGSLKNIAARFDQNKNAAYTFVTKQGTSYQVSDYNDMPKTHQGFETIDSLTITNFTQRDEVKKVTFTFWLEGWDADCFEPIMGQPVSVTLAFTGTDVINKHTINYIDRGTQTTVDYLVSNLLTSVTPYLPYNFGYTFGGWYTDESYTTLFDFAEPVTTYNQVRSAYAKWE